MLTEGGHVFVCGGSTYGQLGNFTYLLNNIYTYIHTHTHVCVCACVCVCVVCVCMRVGTSLSAAAAPSANLVLNLLALLVQSTNTDAKGAAMFLFRDPGSNSLS
jgi:hypothetical protein